MSIDFCIQLYTIFVYIFHTLPRKYWLQLQKTGDRLSVNRWRRVSRLYGFRTESRGWWEPGRQMYSWMDFWGWTERNQPHREDLQNWNGSVPALQKFPVCETEMALRKQKPAYVSTHWVGIFLYQAGWHRRKINLSQHSFAGTGFFYDTAHAVKFPQPA